MNRILVVTNGESDLLRLLRTTCNVTVCTFDDVFFNVDDFDAFCFLAGQEDNYLN